MRSVRVTLVLFVLLSGISLIAVGCTWTETRRDYPPEALISPHHDHSQH